jgi:hypothetical protein
MGVILRRETAANRVQAAIGPHRAARVARKGHNKTGLGDGDASNLETPRTANDK